MSALKVRDLMTDDPITVTADTDLARVRNLMYENWIRHVPVVDDVHALLGLISHRDLLKRSLVEREDVPPLVEEEVLASIRSDQVMRTLVETTEPDASIAEAARILLHNKFGCLPVLRDARLVGILTESDFVEYVASL